MAIHTFTIERVTYQSDDGSFTIARVLLDEPKGHPTTILGDLPGIGPGLRLRAEAEWVRHPKYGKQLRVSSFTILEMHDAAGILRYLSSGAVDGLGPALAQRIVEHFGDQTIQILDTAPHRLIEIHGIGKSTAGKVSEVWGKNRKMREAMLFLHGLGIGSGFGGRIYRQYGGDTMRVVREEPYRLVREVKGIGFATADGLAQALGLDPSHPARLAAGLSHVLDRATDEGHLYLPSEALLHQAEKLLAVEQEAIGEELELSIGRGEVIDEEGRIYAPELYACECEVGERLLALSRATPRSDPRSRPIEDDINAVARKQQLEFSERQRLALHEALGRKLLVVTGGPGTGKTTITMGLISLFARRGLEVKLAAPTGRAARRLADASGRPAATIHRLLLFDPEQGTFTRNEGAPLSCDVLIVDEASMIDVILMRHLLRALPAASRLILIGDVDQLPSVGPGTLLRDCIVSRVGGVVVLDRIFRQEETSRIVLNAHHINRGEMPDLTNGNGFFFIPRSDPEEIADTVTELVSTRLPSSLGLHPRDDIQVITPMYRGAAGAHNLNRRIRDEINPEGQALRQGEREFRVGDKVMQLRNNYDKMVFNGDIGTIVALVRLAGENGLRVQFTEERATYASSELDELTPAYAVTVHKSQGSEFPAVILPVTNQHYVMLQRNLLYTALTRARRLAIFVGTHDAVRLAVGRDQVRRRYSALSERLVASAVGTYREN